MEMMGNTSSQPATQTQVAGSPGVGAGVIGSHNTKAGASVQNTPPERARGRGKGKLKTYSGKKRLSSGKPKAAVANKDGDAQDAPSAKASSELGDPTSPQPKRARARGRGRAQPQTEDIPFSQAEVEAEEMSTPDAELPQLSQNSQRRARVTRNRSLLDSVRRNKPRTKDTQRAEGDEASNGQAQTPPATGQITDAVKVSSWLSHGEGSSQPLLNGASHPEGVDPSSHGYGALLHHGSADAQEEANEEDDIEAEPREYEPPSESGDDYEPEEVEASNTKSKPASKKGNTKRKRDSSEKAAAPAKKRQRKAEVTTARSSQAQTTTTAPRPGVENFPIAGPFTQVEIALVETVFNDTRNALGLTRPEMIYRIQTSSKEISQMLTTITNDVLPNRNRKAVQRFCRRHYNDFQRGPWTPEQDEMLSAAFAENPQKWKFIGERVGRMAEDCRDRWRNHLSLAETRHTDVWTKDEELVLVKAIRDSIVAARAELSEDISPEDEDQFITWHIVVKKMGGLRNRLQCTNKWKKLRQRANRPAEELEVQALSKEDERLEKAQGKKSFKHLRMGDIYAMLKEIQYSGFIGRIEHPATFWAVVTKMHPASPYTTVERKLAFRTIKKLIEDTGDFHKNVNVMIEHMEEHFAEKIKERVRTEDSDRRKSGPARQPSKTYRSAERVEESEDEAAVPGQNNADENGAEDDEEMAVEDNDADDHDGEQADAGAVDEAEAEAAVTASDDQEEAEDPEEENSEAKNASSSPGSAESGKSPTENDGNITPRPGSEHDRNNGNNGVKGAAHHASNSPHISESVYDEE